MKQKWWKALPMLLMMAVLGSGSVRTWKNLAVQAADAAAMTTDTVEKTAQESVPFLSRNDQSEHVFSDDIGQKCD